MQIVPSKQNDRGVWFTSAAVLQLTLWLTSDRASSLGRNGAHSWTSCLALFRRKRCSITTLRLPSSTCPVVSSPATSYPWRTWLETDVRGWPTFNLMARDMNLGIYIAAKQPPEFNRWKLIIVRCLHTCILQLLTNVNARTRVME